MAIYNEEEFNKSLPAGFDGKFECDVFQEAGCFKEVPRIRPMDFDGVVERYCHYLVFETKKDGVEVPPGQLITLNNLRVVKSFTVLKMWPKIPPFKKAEITTTSGKVRVIEGHYSIIRAVRQWFVKANESAIETWGKCNECGQVRPIKNLCDNCLQRR